jgi:polyphosphate kinase
MTPITDPVSQGKLGEILRLQVQDNELAFELESDGEYHSIIKSEGEKVVNNQEFFEGYLNKIFKTMKKSSDQDKVQILASKLFKES